MQEESAIEGQRVCGRRHSPTLISVFDVFDVFDVSRLKLARLPEGEEDKGEEEEGKWEEGWPFYIPIKVFSSLSAQALPPSPPPQAQPGQHTWISLSAQQWSRV